MRALHSLVAWAVAGAMGLMARGALAQPVDTFGLDARSMSLSGGVSADVSDPSAVYYNPAGLVGAKETSVATGFDLVSPSLEIGNDSDSRDSILGWSGGMVVPGRLFGLPFALGIAARVPDTGLSRSRTPQRDRPFWLRYDTHPDLVYFGTGIAIRPADFLSVGASWSFLAATRGQFRVRGTAVLPGADRTEYDSRLEHRLEADLVTVRYPSFGATIDPLSWLRGAVTYRESTLVDPSFSADLAGNFDAGFVEIPVAYTVTTRVAERYVPRQLTFGASYRGLPSWTVNADFTWSDWSEFPTPFARTNSRLEITPPPGLVIDPPPSGPGPGAPAPGFSDTLTARLGVERVLSLGTSTSAALRAGYAFEQTPVPDETFFVVDTDRHSVSVGAGLRAFEEKSSLVALDVDVVGRGYFLSSRQLLLLADPSVSPVDGMAAPASASNRNVEVRGALWGVGGTVTLRFP